jgi:hypothetical protein
MSQPLDVLPKEGTVSVKTLCVHTGLSKSDALLRIARGEIRAVRAGKRILVDIAGIHQWRSSLPSAARVGGEATGTKR